MGILFLINFCEGILMDIKNLVFEGGGVRGIAYGGALDQLYRMNLYSAVQNVAGSSAGAITACLLALGVKPYSLTEKLTSMDYSRFQDNSFGIFRDTFRILTNYGWNKGDIFEEWIQETIIESGCDKDITLKQLQDKEIGPTLHVTASNLTTGTSTIFNYKTHPDIKVSDAVRASMAYPLFFTPLKLNGCYYVDGGLLNNFPIKLFSDQECTIGFNLVDDDELLQKTDNKIAKIPINGLIGYLKSVVMAIHTNLQQTHIHSIDKDNIVDICIGDVPVLEFNLTDEQIQSLINAGRTAVIKKFDKN